MDHAEELIALLETIGWSRHQLAKRLGCSPALVQRWVEGVAPVPNHILPWLRPIARSVTPAPEWRVNRGYI